MAKISTPRVTIDPVVLTFSEDKLQVLLVRRTTDPEKGVWALPGGHVMQDEVMMTSIERNLHQKAGVSVRAMGYVDQLYAFDTTGLDPRGHAITIAFLCLSNHVSVKKDASGQPQFFDIGNLPELAFDHLSIVLKAKERLAELSLKTTIASKVLQENFTMSQLQQYYQILMGKKLDRRNLRKKILSLNIIEDTGKREEGVSNRPGHLYRFKSKLVSDLTGPFS